MKKICKISGKEFEISEEDQKFYKKLGIPEPTICPEERCRRRFVHRNERHLYRRKSNLSGKEILSSIHPDELFKVFSPEEWWSDAWDAADYGRDYDFSRPFFEQLADLQKEVPMISLHVVNNQNCPYVNYIGDCKNCYMIFGPIYSEDCYYGSPYMSRNCVDSLLVRDSELCYECVTCDKCYSCFFCQDCVNSRDLVYCYECRGCNDCIGCVGLRNKKYCVFNEQFTKEEYAAVRKNLNFCDTAGRGDLAAKFKNLKLKSPHRAMVSVNIEDCTGNYIYESKNAVDSFDVKKCHDCAYCAQVVDMKDCHDCNYTEEDELCCEYLGYYRVNNCQYSLGGFNVHDAKYMMHCVSGGNLFGCIALKNKNYCILNKQYKREEYEEMIKRIIEHMQSTGEWGEFFPSSLSPFCYNESVAQEYFPLTKEEALKRGYRWREKDPKEYKKQSYVVPVKISDAPESIVNAILACVECGKNFKIIAPELRFYKRFGLPVPEKCPDCRHKARLSMRTPRTLWERKCAKCGKAIKTSYSPTEPEMVYCEECYLAEIH